MTVVLWILAGILAVFLLTVIFGAPYVPSHPKALADVFTKLYPLSPKDLLVDVGSGDGAVLRLAAKHGARAVGYEINPILVLLSRILSRHEHLVTIYMHNFLHVQLPKDTTVVYIFGIERLMPKIYQILQGFASTHRRSVYLISFGFTVRGVKPIKKSGAAFLYEIRP